MSIDVSPIFWKSDANLKKYDLESNFGGQVCALQKYFPIPFLFSKKTDRKYPHLKGGNISHQICLGGKCEKICCKNIENPKLDPPPFWWCYESYDSFFR